MIPGPSKGSASLPSWIQAAIPTIPSAGTTSQRLKRAAANPITPRARAAPHTVRRLGSLSITSKARIIETEFYPTGTRPSPSRACSGWSTRAPRCTARYAPGIPTIALYARRKRWPLDEVAVRLRHSRVHAEDCADCETKQGMLDVIEREISLSGKLSQDQRGQLRGNRGSVSRSPYTDLGDQDPDAPDLTASG